MSGEERELLPLAASAVKRALAQGAEAADVYATSARTTTITAFGAYVTPHESVQEGAAIRLRAEGRLGQAGSSGLHRVEAAIADALTAAGGTGGRAAPLPLAPPVKIPDASPDATLAAGDADRMSAVVERVSARLRAHPEVTYARVTLVNGHRRIGFANSTGLEAYHETVSEQIELEVRVTRGAVERTAFDSWNGVVPVESTRDVETMADHAVARARAALDPRPLPRAVDEVILTAGPASQIVGIFAGALSGVGADAGKSPLEGRLGERVVSDRLTFRDLPHDRAGRARRLLDDEGTPTRDLDVVDRGVLRSLVHTRASALAAGVEPTGHGLRKDVHSSVAARPINLTMQPGRATLEELVRGATRAVLVDQPLMGAFVASRVTGDFSLVAPFAFYVEDGEIRHALPPTTVGGNAHRVLDSVIDVGDDPRPCRAGVVCSLRAGGVSCAT